MRDIIKTLLIGSLSDKGRDKNQSSKIKEASKKNEKILISDLDPRVDGKRNDDISKELKYTTLLTEYEELRAEMRVHLREHGRIWVRGIAAVGLISGYAFYAPNGLILLTIIPFVLGIFFIVYTSVSNWMTRIAMQIAAIEDEIDVEKFDFETNTGAVESFDLKSKVHIGVLYVLSLCIYLATLIIGLYVVKNQPTTPGIYGLYLTHDILFIIYLLLTISLFAVGVSHIMITREEKAKVREN